MKLRIKGFTINKKEIDKKVSKSKKFQQEAHKLANQKVEKAKQNMMQEFNSHPITQEIEGGTQASNMSGTLGGYGNLFSFMGFSSSDKPIESIRRFLQSFVKIKNQKTRRTNTLTKDFSVSVPTLNDFGFAKMPWESGNSWIKSVEKGMSSFSYYMHKAHQASRAGVGIQIDNRLRGKSSIARKYMSTILNNFSKRLSK